MTLAVQLLTYNGAKFLPALFESLVGQTDRDWTLLILDNASRPEERAATRAHVASFRDRLPITYTESEVNTGFAGGHQLLFVSHQAELVFLVNQDTLLAADYINRVRGAFATDPRVGAAAGCILRWDFDASGAPVKGEIVDSLGLERTSWHQVRDIGSGRSLAESGATVIKPDVFGVSGCLPFYRRTAVAGTDVEGRLFDPAYGSYKEDVDMAYRLARGTWKTAIVADAVAYHHRSFRPGEREGVSLYAEYHSYRNHLWNLLTNLTLRDWLMDGIFVVGFETLKVVYFLTKRPSVVNRAWRETVAHGPAIKARRRFLETL